MKPPAIKPSQRLREVERTARQNRWRRAQAEHWDAHDQRMEAQMLDQIAADEAKAKKREKTGGLFAWLMGMR